MSDLKEYWDSIPEYGDESIDVERALSSVNVHIHNSHRAKWMTLVIALPLAAAAITLSTLAEPEESGILQAVAPAGEHLTVELSDGSTVTLNSGSSLAYSSSYKKGKRDVVLSGEAKFEVAANPRRPFTVRTRDFDVRVFGTVFYVSSYMNRKSSSVVLESGSVAVVRDEDESYITPGQKAEVNSDGDLTISNVQVEDYFNWINGGFVHKQASIDDIIGHIRNTYGFMVQCDFSQKYLDAVITFKSDTSLSIEEYLGLLSDIIPGMQYIIADKTLILK